MSRSKAIDQVSDFISLEEAVRLSSFAPGKDIGFAYDLAALICQRYDLRFPNSPQNRDFYILSTVFHAGRIAGIRSERARRAGLIPQPPQK